MQKTVVNEIINVRRHFFLHKTSVRMRYFVKMYVMMFKRFHPTVGASSKLLFSCFCDGTFTRNTKIDQQFAGCYRITRTKDNMNESAVGTVAVHSNYSFCLYLNFNKNEMIVTNRKVIRTVVYELKLLLL